MRRYGSLLLLFAALACEGDQIGRESPKLVLAPAPGTTIDIGTHTAGARATEVASIVAKNEGNAALRFSSIAIEGSTELEVIGAPEALAPNESRSMTLRFTPVTPGPLMDTALVVESNDPELPIARLPLEGDVVEPCRIRLTPVSATFALEETIRFTITNPTISPCRIIDIETDPTFFPLVDPPEIPFDIPAGGERQFDVFHTRAAFSGQPVRELVVRATGQQTARATLSGQDRTPCLSLSREEIFFPPIEVGSRTQTSLEVISECPHDVTITALNIDSADGGFSPATMVPQTVVAGGRRRIEVLFEPAGGPFFLAYGTLTIETDDFADRFLRAALIGRILRPSGTVHPNVLDFGPVVYDPMGAAGSPSTCASEINNAQIINTGFSTLTVRELTLNTSGEFEMLYVEVGGTILMDWTPPFDIPPGTEARIGLQYRPTAATEHTSQLVIRHDADQNAEVVGLVGRGEERTMITETFQQPTELQVDLLWAIDASCSMGDEQAELIANLSGFVAYADAQGVDYQMAVVEAEERSTNAGEFERCPGHPRVIPSDYMTTTVRDQAFECLFDLGTNGIGIESGMGGARLALNRALAAEQNPVLNPNAGFVRPGAELVIVAISDEDDQSTIPDVVLRDFFIAAKDNQRNRVSLHAIAGPLPSGCPGASPGTRYANVVRFLNGNFYSICEPDWSPVLQNLGLDVFTPERQWYLSRPADESTIVVTVDGVPVASDPVNGWIYEPSRRVVLFTGTAVPEPGAEIIITYMPGCAG